MNKKILIIGLGLMVGIVSYGLYQSYQVSESVDVINLPLANKIKTFDPAIAFDDDSLTVMGQSLETLYQYHYLKRPYEIIPGLAQEMPKILKNGHVYQIKIRPGIFYHPHPALSAERTVIAQDFVNQFKRLLFYPLRSTGEWILKDRIFGANEFQKSVGDNFSKMLSISIAGVRAIGQDILEIELIKPDPNLIFYLTMYFTVPVPLEVLEFERNNLADIMVGTGPFRLISTDQDRYHLTQFKNFRKELYPSVGDRYANTENLLESSEEIIPFVKEVNFYIVPTEEEQWNKFFEKKLDIISVPSLHLTDVTKQNGELQKKLDENKVELKYFPKITNRWLGFNMKDPVLGGSKGLPIRKAIAYALDRDMYIKEMSQNTSLKANSIYNPSIPGYSPGVEWPYEYSLSEAKKILKEIGISEQRPLKLRYSTRGISSAHKKEANFIVTSLKKVGIDVDVEYLSFDEFLRKGRAGNEMQFWTDNWIYDYPDAENLIQLLISKNYPGLNKSGYTNSQVDRLYNELIEHYEQSIRYEYMQDVEKMVLKDLPWIMLMYETSYTLNRRDLKNYRKSFFIRNFVKYLKKTN